MDLVSTSSLIQPLQLNDALFVCNISFVSLKSQLFRSEVRQLVSFRWPPLFSVFLGNFLTR